MGKQFRKRLKKRKQERSAKHRRPTTNATPTSSSSAGAAKGNIHPGTQKTRTRSAEEAALLRWKRSPVLSRYLDPESNVLVVGDGDFSFGQALVQLRSKYHTQEAQQQKKNGTHDDNNSDDNIPSCGSVTVTGHDSRAEALQKYASSKGNNKSKYKNTDIVQSLRTIGNQQDAAVLHSIDATKLNQQLGPDDKNNHQYYDVVVFNFPHSGQQRVHINRNLMYDFFQSVRDLFLAQTKYRKSRKRNINAVRQVHVTIKNQRPYIHWDIEASAKEAGFRHHSKKVQFDMELWNSLGYRHQTTVGPQQATSQPQLLSAKQGERKTASSEAKLAQTWIFEFEQDCPVIGTTGSSVAGSKNISNKGPDAETPPNQKSVKEHHIPKQHKHQQSSNSDDDDDDVKKQPEQLVKQTTKNKGNEVSSSAIEEWVQKRNQARQDKNWAEADRIRELLQNDYGVLLCDQKGAPTTWMWQQQTSGKKEQKKHSIIVNTEGEVEGAAMPKKKKRKRKHANNKDE